MKSLSTLKKLLALVMVFCMSMSMFSVLAFAADGDPVVSGSGTQEDPKVTVIVTESSEGNRNSVSTETVTEWSDVDEDGYGTTFEETETETHVTVEEGRPLYDETTSQGSEITVSEQVDITSTITMILIEDGKSVEDAEGTSNSAGTTETDNLDHIGGSTNRYYDYTTTTETDRTSTGTAGEAETSYGHAGEEDYVSQQTQMTSVFGGWSGNEVDMADGHTYKYTFPMLTAPEGYDYRYCMWSEDSDFGAKIIEYDENGQVISTTYEDIIQFDIANPDGTHATAHCVDVNTIVVRGGWYRLDNLDEADYYSEADENHIRAIALNGYWGVDPTEEDPTPLGSLPALKAFLREAGYEQTGMTEEDIEALTEGEASAATQIALWTYGNRYTDNRVDIVASDYNGGSNYSESAANAHKRARIDTLVDFFVTLSMTEEEAGTTQVISDAKFVEDMSLNIGGKVDGHENNADDDDTNDAYNVDLVFSLVVQPSAEDDDLIVKIVDSEGNVVKTARLAGDDSSTNYGTIVPDENGNYTISGLQLVEGSDVNFDITLEGAQYLNQGVYIYTSEYPDETQTMIGIAEGYHEVDVSMDVTLSFDVDEASITTERVWNLSNRTDYIHTEEEPEEDPEEDPEEEPEIPDEEVPKDPGSDDEEEEDPGEEPEIPDEEVPGGPGDPPTDIPEEGVPTTDVPATGDVSAIWLALSLLSGGGFAGVAVLGKKNSRKDKED